MKIISLLPILSYGDAVGNDALAIHRSLKRAGFECEIAACYIDSQISSIENVRGADDLSFIHADDLVIYHFSTGHELNRDFACLKCHKILRYHNITPPHFFCGYSRELEMNCIRGYREISCLAGKVDCCIADSSFNKNELIRMGFRCDIAVVPILVPFDDYQKNPDTKILDKYKDDGYTNFLFTGRISPNKRQEDVISVFHQYQKNYNADSRLFLVGKYDGMEKYYEKLCDYAEKLSVKNIFFTGHISFSEILAYYHLADIFLCMSDHEGFCVPIVEAMKFQIPIVAKETTAVPETMGNGGFAVSKEADKSEIAGICNYVLTNNTIREQMLAEQKRMLAVYEFNAVYEKIYEIIRKFESR